LNEQVAASQFDVTCQHSARGIGTWLPTSDVPLIW
jgi:hypothetical protein